MSENGGFPCFIDGLQVLATGAGLSSLILRVLGAVPVVSDMLTFLEMRIHQDRSRDSMPLSLQSRRDCSYCLFLYQNKRISTFFSSEKTIAACDLIFFSNDVVQCREEHVKSTIASINNCGNDMSLKS